MPEKSQERTEEMMSDKKCRQVMNFYRLFVKMNGAVPIKVASKPSIDIINICDSADLIAEHDPSADRFNDILDLIGSILHKKNYEAFEIDYDACFSNKQEAMNHLLSMLPKMAKFASDSREEKFYRWLGFIFGTFAAYDNISDKKTAYDHLFWMSIEMEDILKRHDRLPFFLWLGVMQGIFCSYGVFTLNELRNHLWSDNKPETP